MSKFINIFKKSFWDHCALAIYTVKKKKKMNKQLEQKRTKKLKKNLLTIQVCDTFYNV